MYQRRASICITKVSKNSVYLLHQGIKEARQGIKEECLSASPRYQRRGENTYTTMAECPFMSDAIL